MILQATLRTVQPLASSSGTVSSPLGYLSPCILYRNELDMYAKPIECLNSDVLKIGMHSTCTACVDQISTEVSSSLTECYQSRTTIMASVKRKHIGRPSRKWRIFP